MTNHATNPFTIESAVLTGTVPVEVPAWHLELPLRWPRIAFACPGSARGYSFPRSTPISLEKRAPVPSVKAKKKRKIRRRKARRKRFA